MASYLAGIRKELAELHQLNSEDAAAANVAIIQNPSPVVHLLIKILSSVATLLQHKNVIVRNAGLIYNGLILLKRLIKEFRGLASQNPIQVQALQEVTIIRGTEQETVLAQVIPHNTHTVIVIQQP